MSAQITVVGDLTVDWAIFVSDGTPGLQLPYEWERRDTLKMVGMPGGASLLATVLASFDDELHVTGPEFPPGALQEPAFDGVTKTYATWTPRPGSRAEPTWMQDRFLGIATASRVSYTPASTDHADVIVIDDANLGFRDTAANWTPLIEAIANNHLPVVIKMAPPLGSGKLWEALSSLNSGSVICYVTEGDLRTAGAPIGQPLSWERTAYETVAAVRSHAALRHAGLVVVGFGLAGAAVIPNHGAARLIYDPAFQEGSWEAEHRGAPYAVGTTITAGLAAALSLGGASTVDAGLTRGLELARALHVQGLASDGQVPLSTDASRAVLDPAAESAFRCREIAEGRDWHLLGTDDPLEYRRLAEAIVERGIRGAGPDIPVEQMGSWASVDRSEIESMRSVHHIVREYLERSVRQRPLNLAVFGPPGSGKSFAIKQMANQWTRDGTRVTVLEFNVAQLHDDAALGASFQRVRDCAVEGTLPLVFFDEFDSVRGGHELGWLARFLAPMQDGTFLEGSLVRPIGPAIFVFAGGIHPTIESFKERAAQLPGAKATDFLSRLRGYVNVLGPNASSAEDDSFVVRRAFLLRQILERQAPQIISEGQANIDRGVMRAFLAVGAYVHGARSLESIVEMSALTGRSRFDRSSLPAAHQLSLHVDPEQFLALVESG